MVSHEHHLCACEVPIWPTSSRIFDLGYGWKKTKQHLPSWQSKLASRKITQHIHKFTNQTRCLGLSQTQKMLMSTSIIRHLKKIFVADQVCSDVVRDSIVPSSPVWSGFRWLDKDGFAAPSLGK
jgi:hypothetical protein